MPPILLAERVRALRRERNWTIDELVVRTGVSYAALSRLERSTPATISRKITIGTVLALAEALEASLDYLVGRTPVRTLHPPPPPPRDDSSIIFGS